MGKLPSTLLRRPTLLTPTTTTTTTTTTKQTTATPHTLHHQQLRHATFVPRPRRPYQFTQLVQLSDGSTFTVRTTSPSALYRSTKDSRNHILWQPSDKTLKNVEVDEAGKLAAFRERFGRGWDMEDAPPAAAVEGEAGEAGAATTGKSKAEMKMKREQQKQQQQQQREAEAKADAAAAEEDPFDSLVDLISQYSKEDANKMVGKSAKEEAKEREGGKKRR